MVGKWWCENANLCSSFSSLCHSTPTHIYSYFVCPETIMQSEYTKSLFSGVQLERKDKEKMTIIFKKFYITNRICVLLVSEKLQVSEIKRYMKI
jgi:hypothetical protein